MPKTINAGWVKHKNKAFGNENKSNAVMLRGEPWINGKGW